MWVFQWLTQVLCSVCVCVCVGEFWVVPVTHISRLFYEEDHALPPWYFPPLSLSLVVSFVYNPLRSLRFRRLTVLPQVSFSSVKFNGCAGVERIQLYVRLSIKWFNLISQGPLRSSTVYSFECQFSVFYWCNKTRGDGQPLLNLCFQRRRCQKTE